MAENNTPENDDDLEVNIDDEVDESQETGEEEEEFTPPSKEELKQIRDALAKANAEAKKYRLEVKNLKQQNKETPEEEDEKVSAAKKEVEEFYRPRLVRSAVKAALKDAGLKGTPERLLKLVDVADFEIDENGEVDEDDLGRTVESLKTDYPELFVSSRAPRIDGGREATGARKTTKDSAEVLFERIKNPARR